MNFEEFYSQLLSTNPEPVNEEFREVSFFCFRCMSSQIRVVGSKADYDQACSTCGKTMKKSEEIS